MRLKNSKQLDALRESGKRLEQVMFTVARSIAEGVSTQLLDEVAEREMLRLGSKPVFKGYGAEEGNPFPASTCVSLNDEVVHGIPKSDRILRAGDIVKIDMGLRYNGMVSDMARTFAVGSISKEAEHLMRVTEEGLLRGIYAIRIGARLSDYGKTVQKYVESEGFSVVRDLVGHGVGFELHEYPQIPNYSFSGSKNIEFCSGMAVALEPMVNAGDYAVRLGKDGWVFVTQDGRLSAHFEDTVIITDAGVEMVTRTKEN